MSNDIAEHIVKPRLQIVRDTWLRNVNTLLP
jgi:hypothetical protein